MDDLEFPAQESLDLKFDGDTVILTTSRALIQEAPVSVWIEADRLPRVIEYLTQCLKEIETRE